MFTATLSKGDMVYTPTHRNITQTEERMKHVICSNMDGPRNYHTTLSKSERKRQTSYYHLLNMKVKLSVT